ncbi:MAG: PHP domain-containing protein [Gemmatimonadaceae bacterium]
MDCRSAALALSQIATLLELHGDDSTMVRAMQAGARLAATGGDRPLHDARRDGPLTDDAVDPAVCAVLTELDDTHSASLLERLQEETPEGLLEMLRIPGLGPSRIRQIHLGLQLETVHELEQAARDGRLAALPRFGETTAKKILQGIADLHATGAALLWQHGHAEAERLREAIAAHPDVLQVAIAGSIRRQCELVRDLDLVAAVRSAPSTVSAALAQLPGVTSVVGGGGRSLRLRFDTGLSADLWCVRPEHFAVALWRATGSRAHVEAVIARIATHGLIVTGDELRRGDGSVVEVPDETTLYRLAGLAYCAPEVREDADDLARAAQGATNGAAPVLVTEADLVGALHCHSQASDGTATIADMAQAAIDRGLRYLGISDHSQSNLYAGGLTRDAIDAQHATIDALNAEYQRDGRDFRLLKGIEADILPCGRLDYDPALLARFDFVIGSIHTRYGMNARQMTDRVLRALENPHLTILGHPTGRLLLTREPYAIDLDAVLERAAAVGVAVELNADPHRLDLNWQGCRRAAHFGTMISIGPDAHAPQGLDHLTQGVATARKGWLGPAQILNSRSADDVLAFARARRSA